MADLDESRAIGDGGHVSDHNKLHDLYNLFNDLADGQVVKGSSSPDASTDMDLAKGTLLETKADVDALGINAATLEGDNKATIIAAAAAAALDNTPVSASGPITITGDGTATSFDVAHNLGTRSIEWYFEDEANAPLKVSSWVPTVGDELDSSTVSIPGPIGDGDEVYGYAHPATGSAGITHPLYAITGYTATKPTGETIAATYADLAAFEAAVVPDALGEVIQVLGYLVPSSHVGLVGAPDGTGGFKWEIAT
jgi:hypothetical protein